MHTVTKSLNPGYYLREEISEITVTQTRYMSGKKVKCVFIYAVPFKSGEDPIIPWTWGRWRFMIHIVSEEWGIPSLEYLEQRFFSKFIFHIMDWLSPFEFTIQANCFCLVVIYYWSIKLLSHFWHQCYYQQLWWARLKAYKKHLIFHTTFHST